MTPNTAGKASNSKRDSGAGHRLARRIALALVLLLVLGAVWVVMRDTPVPVDVEPVSRGALRVTVDEDGVTEVRDVYTVSSPIAGHLARTALKAGDSVEAGRTVIGSIHPLDPAFLDRRTIAELNAARAAARSAIALAEAERERAEAARALARGDFGRAARLAVNETISARELERAGSEARVAQAQLRSAEANVQLAEAQLASVDARLEQPAPGAIGDVAGGCCIDIVAPADGVVLSMRARSEQVVAAGTVIAELGDARDLQVRIDLLSSDAVRIEPGAPVEIRDWGGDQALAGRVERIEPGAFTRVSALGIEEQRVDVVVTLDEVPRALGHGYRVFGRLTVWEDENALRVPISALFRDGGRWAVFVDDAGIARLAEVDVGQMNHTHAEVLDGLLEGEPVVLYPSDLVQDGSSLRDREASG